MTGEIERAGSGFGPRSALVFRGRWVEELVCCVTAVYVAFAPVGEGAPVASGVRHEASGAKFCAAALPCPALAAAAEHSPNALQRVVSRLVVGSYVSLRTTVPARGAIVCLCLASRAVVLE